MAGALRRVRRPFSTIFPRPNRVTSSTIPCGIIGLTGLHFASTSAATETTPELPEKHFAFLDKYCLECHDALTEKGSVNLEDLSFQITTIQEAELWQKVLNTMNSGEMPPEDETQPEQQEKADFLGALAGTMVDARRALSDTGGEITMRRLNRREYQNSIEYLTGVRVDASSLPADGGGNTFDTEGASQFISSDQIEQYLKLGRSAIGELFERQAAVGQEPKTFRVEPENTVNAESRKRMAALEEQYERYLQWKAEVDKVAFLPENEEALAQIRKKYDLDESLELKDHLRLYQNTNLLKGAPDATKFGFRDGNQASFSYQGGYSRTHAYMKQYLEFPNSDSGTYLKLAWGIQRIDILPDPKDLPPGTYKLRIRAGAVEDSDVSRHFIEVGHPQRVNQVPAGFAGKPLASVQVTGTEENPEIIETTLTIGSKTPREFGIQERRPEGNQKALSREFYRHKAENGYGTPPAIWVDWIELFGPIPDNAAVESTITRIEPEKTINPANEKEIANIEDEQARSAEWQKGVDEAVKTPANQAKIAEIRKAEPKINHPQWFYAFADRLEGTPDAIDFGFRDAQKAAASDPKGDRANLAYHKHYASLPHRDRGTYLKLAHGTGRVIVAPKELPPGSYTLRVAAAAVEGSPASRHFIEVGHPQRVIESRNRGLEGQPVSSHQVTGTIEKPQVIEIPLEVGSDTIKEFAIQEKQPNTGNLKELWDAHNAFKKKNGYGHPPAIWIDWVELEGPHRAVTPASDQDYSWLTDSTGPDDASRARNILEQFAFKAFRGVDAEGEFLDRLVGIFKNRRETGHSFEGAIELPLGIILASPGFLYLNEPSDASTISREGSPHPPQSPGENTKRTLTDRELAVRLAYFLWSAPPDRELLDLASRGELSNPDTLQNQVDRLIADSRSDEFVAGFLHQWLDMERLDFFQFDTTLYRDFDESTRSAARQEVYHSFAHLLRDREGGHLGELLKSDYIFVNGLLATYYGIDGVTGDDFQKVTLPADSPRGGLLGMAAIHAMGSDGIETSPVERGAWVLRHLLNDPPPPAPPNVPQLSRLADQSLTTRERLAAHREEAQCASCHRKIDPIGFGLENFNAAGKWRAIEGIGKSAHPIDSADQFHDGPKFADYFELRNIIANREGDFARGFAEHLIGYGLGRPFGFTDEDLAQEIVGAAEAENFAVRLFVHALVQSEAFRQK